MLHLFSHASWTHCIGGHQGKSKPARQKGSRDAAATAERAIGGVSGIVDAALIEEDVPLRVSMGTLDISGTVLDLSRNQAWLTAVGESVPFRAVPGGH